MGFVSSNGFFGAVGFTGYRVHDRVWGLGADAALALA